MNEYDPLSPARERLVKANRPLEAEWLGLLEVYAREYAKETGAPHDPGQELNWRMFFYAGAKAVWGLMFEDARVAQAYFGTDAPTKAQVKKLMAAVEAEIAIWVDWASGPDPET